MTPIRLRILVICSTDKGCWAEENRAKPGWGRWRERCLSWLTVLWDPRMQWDERHSLCPLGLVLQHLFLSTGKGSYFYSTGSKMEGLRNCHLRLREATNYIFYHIVSHSTRDLIPTIAVSKAIIRKWRWIHYHIQSCFIRNTHYLIITMLLSQSYLN